STEFRSRLEQQRERRDGLHQEVTLRRTEMSNLETDLHAVQTSWNEARSQADVAEQGVHQLEMRVQKADHEIREREGERQHLQQDSTLASVALAQTDERLAAVQAEFGQVEADV